MMAFAEQVCRKMRGWYVAKGRHIRGGVEECSQFRQNMCREMIIIYPILQFAMFDMLLWVRRYGVL